MQNPGLETEKNIRVTWFLMGTQCLLNEWESLTWPLHSYLVRKI